MTSIELLAHAKVNLFLKVLNKRKDSYHNILTLFERISLADKIRIRKTPKGISLICDKFITRSPKDNLAYKAARLMMDENKLNSGVRIEIKKHIPMGAGLGGGSSDGAAVLIGINRLFNLNINTKRLMALAGRLGADVPFFVLNEPFAIGRARGDKLKEARYKNRFWHLIVFPGFEAAAKDIYEAFDTSLLPNPSTGSGFDPESIEGPKCLTRKRRNATINSLLKVPMDFGTAQSMLHNDLEEIIIQKKKVIGTIIERLASSLGRRAIVSGSGPSVFCLYRTRKEANRGRKVLLGGAPDRDIKDWQIFVARTC